LRGHGALDRRPHALVFGRRNPLLTEFLALELQLETVVVIGGRRALNDGAALEHLHADVALVLHGLRHEGIVKGVQHFALARRSDVHFNVEPDVFRLRVSLYTSLVTGSVSLSRLFELLDTPVDVCENPNAGALDSVRGEVTFENVSFRYEESPVLENVSFRVIPGTICAILGRSGVGKSTIADLLVRFYDPDEGTIRLDDHDLRRVRLNDLRNSVVLVDQASFLFQATVRENIAYGNPDATSDAITTAAQAAAIHDRVLALPQQYDTLVGERGLTLSAGERHRITLARALLRNPAVLVLDEPTAALDPDIEREIVDSLRTALRGRTAIVITHRSSLASIADQVITLDGGKISEQAVAAAR
jgi:ATP-binding cassette, subfamily B, bacterial